MNFNLKFYNSGINLQYSTDYFFELKLLMMAESHHRYIHTSSKTRCRPNFYDQKKRTEKIQSHMVHGKKGKERGG